MDLLPPFASWPVVVPLHWDHPEYAPGEGLCAIDPAEVEAHLRAGAPLAVLLLALIRLPHGDGAATATLRSAAEARALIRRLWGLSPREALTAAVTAAPRDPAELAEIVRDADRARAANERERAEGPLRRIREVNARMPAPTPPAPPRLTRDITGGPQVVVVFGSAARRALGQTAENPRDIDVAFGGISREDAEALAAEWAAAHGLAGVPIEAHAHKVENVGQPVYVVIAAFDAEDADAHVVLRGSGDVEIYRPVRDTVAADLRTLRVRGALKRTWYAGLAVGPRPEDVGYFGDGLQALRSAWIKLSEEQQLRAAERYGEVLLRLLERDPTAEELGELGGGALAPAGLVWYARREGCWHAEQPNGEIPAGWMGGVS